MPRALARVLTLALLAPAAAAQATHYTIQGNASDAFGRDLAVPGDLDGDGVADLAVGAPGAGSGGAVGLFSGADGAPLLEVVPAAPTLLFGTSVAPAGDIDGDGVPDLVVGAYADSTEAPSAGRAFVHSGADGRQLHVLAGSQGHEWLGLSVAGVGDVDLDGVPDLAAGAPGHVFGLPEPGRVAVYSGADASILHHVPGLLSGDDFGWTLAALGDVGGDGVPDFAAGALGEVPGPGTGHARLIDGASGVATRLFQPPVPGPDYGLGLLGFDDLDGDGIGELAVGAPLHPSFGFHSGTVFFHSPRTGALVAVVRGTLLEGLGADLARVPDVTGDGADELLVSAPAWPGTQLPAGRVVVVDVVSGLRLAQLDGFSPGGSLGAAVACPGDTDGDGSPEIAIVAHQPGLGPCVEVLGKP